MGKIWPQVFCNMYAGKCLAYFTVLDKTICTFTLFYPIYFNTGAGRPVQIVQIQITLLLVCLQTCSKDFEEASGKKGMAVAKLGDNFMRI